MYSFNPVMSKYSYRVFVCATNTGAPGKLWVARWKLIFAIMLLNECSACVK